MSWWLDPTTGDAFSLVCLPVAGVKIDVARMILREQEAAEHQRESPKESPEEAHERLRKLLDDSL